MTWLMEVLRNLLWRTIAGKIFLNKAFNRYNRFNRFRDKSALGGAIKIAPNEELAKELHKPIIENIKKRKVHPPFIEHTWGADLADMQSLSTFNKGIRLLLRAIDIFNKYAWVVPLKDKNVLQLWTLFKKF